MKGAIKNWRYYVMAAVAVVMMAGLFAEPAEGLSSSDWLGALVVSKLVGVAAGYALYRLVAYWLERGDIPEIVNLITEE